MDVSPSSGVSIDKIGSSRRVWKATPGIEGIWLGFDACLDQHISVVVAFLGLQTAMMHAFVTSQGMKSSISRDSTRCTPFGVLHIGRMQLGWAVQIILS